MELNLVNDLGVSHFVASWAKYDPAELKDKLSSSTRAALVAFADGLLLQVNTALEQLQQYLADDNDAPEQEALDSLEAALQALRIVALLCCEMLHECHANPPEALQTAAVQLHDHALLELGDSRPDVQDAVAKLCVTWWQYEAIDREYLVAQALPYLLARAIGSSQAGHVKACYAMKGALELLDFDDASITDMKRMLLQAAICPAFVSRPEGRKFLSSLLTVHPSMVQEMTSVIRNQIPAGRRSVLDAYGEVILRGWRDAAGPCLAEIENSLIQNLMLAAIHGSGQSLVGNIRRILSELHRSKRLGGAGSVDSMLVRLYEPILFRALAATNAAVRRNSLQLLLDAFPLLDPESSTEEQDELLVRQFQCLSDGLTDNCPSVRVVAAQGICTVLNLYWEIIPSATTAGYVSRLTGQLAFDGALPAVRVAVLEGLQLLVDNQHAQPVLKKALPSLAPLMWDPSPRVREAMADLLLCISTSRGLHFWEVVPLEVLLEQMGIGSGPSDAGVHQRLHQLLVPSYFPNPQEGAARIAALLKEHPVAGQAFCRMLVAPFIQYIDSNKGCHQVQVPLEDILQLATSLMKHLLDHPPVSDPRSPPRKQRTRKGGQGGETSEAAAPATGRGNRGKRKKAPAPATPAPEDGSTAEAGADTAEAEAEVDVVAVGVRDESEQSWQALLAGLAEICSGIGMALQHELCDEQDVQDMFVDDALQQLLAVCPTSAAERSVWHIAESLPCLSAVKQLLTSRMQLLAAGQLIPADVDATAAVSSSSSGSSAALEATAVLACLAAGSTGPKLAAMLCVGLGLQWSGASSSAVAHAAASAGSAAADEPQNSEDVVCRACGHTQPEHNMLLCDGCDVGYHMTCLEPELTAVPEGDWFCPSCCREVKACVLSRSTAIQHLSLLLLSDSGRQLLQRDQLLQRALPLLQQDAASAAAAAQQRDSGADALVKTVNKALRAGVLYARAAVHVAAQAAEEQPLLLAQGYTNVLQQLANSCNCLRQLNPMDSTSPATAQQLLPHIHLLSALLKDTWAILKALNGLGPFVEGAGAAVAAAAGSAADVGSSLLAGLMVASRAAGDVDDTMKGVLVLNTQVLKALLKSQFSPLPQQQLSAWLLLWLEALTNTPLAAAAAAIRSDIPALVAALLGEHHAKKPGTRAAAGSTGTAEGTTGGVAIDEWLPALVKAAAEVEECEVQEGSQQEATDDDTAQDTENQNPNVAAPASDADKVSKVAKGRSSQQKAGLTMGLILSPVLEAVVTAVRRHQAEPRLASRCLHDGISKAQQEDWESSLGSFRLWCCLGHAAQELSAAELESLKGVRHRAVEDNGTVALLLEGLLQKVLDCADAAQ